MKITRFEAFIERSVPYFIGLVILVILLVMGSCSNVKGNNNYDASFAWTVVEINGCQFIVRTNYYESAPQPLHHPNCKNHKPCE